MTGSEDYDGPRTAEFLGGPMDGERVPVLPTDFVLGATGPGMRQGDFHIRLAGDDPLRFIHSSLIPAYRDKLDPDAAIWLSDNERRQA